MTGFQQPLGLITTPADDQHLYIIERQGRIRKFDRLAGSIVGGSFLDIRDRVFPGQDGGLVGAAFDPNFAVNGYVYVQYTAESNEQFPPNQLSRFTLRPDGSGLDPTSEHKILYIDQPHSAHNGDWIGFGPDGMLYYTTGDGGNQHDPGNNGQDTTTLRGSVLRIDVTRDDFPADPEANYGIPSDNPFVGTAGRDEIWAHGLRNPWRASFDRATGDFYIGDTSQDTWEEVNFISASSSGGENFGWRLREGFVSTPTGGVGGEKTPDMVDPVYAYRHGSRPNQGDSVIGGYVYRGPIESELLQGQYFFSDWVNNRIWSIEVDSSTGLMVDESFRDWTTDFQPDLGSLSGIASWGEDNEGNLYMLNLGGDIFRITEIPSVPEPQTLGLFAAAGLAGRFLRRRCVRQPMTAGSRRG